MADLTPQQIARIHEDGFLILDRLIDSAEAAEVAACYQDLFSGRFETGLYPDEWNWQEGRGPPDRTRQICNGWKSDRKVAGLVLRAEIGRLCATLAGWPGARLAQDNLIWKPPGAKSLGFHQDDSYTGWMVPGHMLTCWFALDRTTAAGGTIEYVRGSHKWPVWPPIKQVHAPDGYRREMHEAAAAVGIAEPELVPVEVPPGGCAFHDGRTWHGSDRNRANLPRRSAVGHCMSLEVHFHPTSVNSIHNRYKRVGDETMDESFFPVLWRRDGYRTPFLDGYARKASVGAG